jgi:chemotaxis family two-component system sensor histidine kinase/response regulator PixL
LLDEQITELIEQLSQRLNRHQSTLNELRDLPLQGNNPAFPQMRRVSTVTFDTLEMDIYTEFNLKLHEAFEETLQLQETTESLDLLSKQANQIGDKKNALTLNIIENLVEARMLPLGTILNRFPQMVSKLGTVYAKPIKLKLVGTHVLVDKAIAERLYDPLLQLVRNAFDHGIEPPQVRRELGKSETGLIEIRSYHQGSYTVIEVRDDGSGLNFAGIRQRAIDLHLLADDQIKDYTQQPTEEELIEVMFSPGFSTAGQVSEISGRGMGLDIVRTQLQALNGLISVQSSPGQGTTFILKIPFSMTTDKLMLVQAGVNVYALLLDSIEKIVIPSAQQVQEFEGNQVLHWRVDDNEYITNILRLSSLIDYSRSLIKQTDLSKISSLNQTETPQNPILLIRRNQGVLGLEVDLIIGEQELVIRPLGSAITPPKYVYGCSSLANGNLILVIDASLLVETRQIQATLDISPLPTVSTINQPSLAVLESTVEFPHQEKRQQWLH